MTSRSSTIFVLFNCTGAASVVIASWSKVIGMTGGAEADVLRELIVDSLAVTVAGYTRDCGIVVARIVAGRMGKIDRCPSVCGMANITFLRGYKMCR